MKLKSLLKSLLCSYAVTGVLLLLLAFLLFKLDLSETVVATGIVVIYILSCFFGGLVMGKHMGKKKYLWGMFLGLCYFILLIGVSWMVERQMDMSLQHAVTTFCMCLGGGTLGGMIS